MDRTTAIDTPKEHEQAIDVIGRIMALQTPDDADLAMLETLAIRVARYEETMFPLGQPTVLEAIRFRMDQMDLNQAGLAELIGFPKSRISDLLSGRPPLSLEMIRAVHEKLGIPTDILIGKSKAANAS